jgi:hypothetical protein
MWDFRPRDLVNEQEFMTLEAALIDLRVLQYNLWVQGSSTLPFLYQRCSRKGDPLVTIMQMSSPSARHRLCLVYYVFVYSTYLYYNFGAFGRQKSTKGKMWR